MTNYNFLILSEDGRPVRCLSNHCFTNRNHAVYFARGLAKGLEVCRHEWGVVIIPDGDLRKANIINGNAAMRRYFESLKNTLI